MPAIDHNGIIISTAEDDPQSSLAHHLWTNHMLGDNSCCMTRRKVQADCSRLLLHHICTANVVSDCDGHITDAEAVEAFLKRYPECIDCRRPWKRVRVL